MMELNSTKYPNNIRTVTGNVTLYSDDCILDCDTTQGPVTINLDSIPSNYWSTIWRLYVIDSGANAYNNNITINAPTGFNINNASSVVINYNGGGGYILVLNNTNYLYIPNTGVSQVYDTGWKQLNGFSWIVNPMLAPQYRIIGKEIIFRNNWIVPLADGSGNVIQYTVDSNGISNYEGAQFTSPYQGNGGVQINAGGAIFFNFNSTLNAVQSCLSAADTALLDGGYLTGWQIGNRRLFTSQGSSFESYLTSVAQIGITSNGFCYLDLLMDAEIGVGLPITGPQNGLGTSNLRFLSSQTQQGNYLPAYININGYGGSNPPTNANNMTDLSNNPATFISNPTNTPLQLKVANALNTLGVAPTHVLNIDAGDPYQMGGFMFNSLPLKAYSS